MKIHSQVHTKISCILLFTFLSLNSAIAYSQDRQKNNENTTQLTNAKLNTLAAIPKKIEREKLESKAALATFSVSPALPTRKIIATKVALTKRKQLPDKETLNKKV
jgi:hypothetical protein